MRKISYSEAKKLVKNQTLKNLESSAIITEFRGQEVVFLPLTSRDTDIWKIFIGSWKPKRTWNEDKAEFETAVDIDDEKMMEFMIEGIKRMIEKSFPNQPDILEHITVGEIVGLIPVFLELHGFGEISPEEAKKVAEDFLRRRQNQPRKNSKKK